MKVVIGCLLGLLIVQAGSAFSFGKYFGVRITEGQDASPGQFPYQVSMQWGVPPFVPLMHACGGSIINEYWILTAGHCVTSVPKIGKTNVKVGKHHILLDDSHVQTVDIVKKIVHKDYPGNVAPNDIALLKLKKPLVFTDRVQPVSLPKADSVQKGVAVLSGWGSTSKNFLPKLPRVLQTATIPIVPNPECVDAMAAIDDSAKIYDTQMCTGPLDGTVSACSGDSGGPLVQNEQDDVVQVGIVSWGMIPCGSIGAPSVYTRVSSFVEWIHKTMDEN